MIDDSEALPQDHDSALSTAVVVNYRLSGVHWERVNVTLTFVPWSETSGVFEGKSEAQGSILPPVQKVLDANPGMTGLFLVNGTTAYELPCEELEDDALAFTINVTNFEDRKRVPSGSFRILPVIRGQVQPFATIAMADVATLDPSARIFQYANNKSAYAVTFDITEDDLRPELVFRSYQYATGGGKKKKGLIGRVKRKIKGLTSKSRMEKLLNKYYRVCRKLNRPTGSRLLFASEARREMGGNLLSIYNKIQERGLEFEIHESFSVPATLTKREILRRIRLIAKADVVVLDDYFSMLNWLKVSKDTVVVQAWHAGSGFKNVGFSRFGKYGSPKLEHSHRKYTYSIAGSTQLVETYSEAFGIEPSAIIPTGLPRVDDFLDPDAIAAFKEKFYKDYPQLEGKKLVLFAPTFRGRGMATAYYDYSQIDFDRFYEYCGDDTVILFRMHHFIHEEIPIPEQYRDKFLNFTHFADGLNLLHVTDIMITDYSSIIYEFSMLDRPMLFFSYDREVYEATRGFHRNYIESAPGKVCDTFDDLMTALETHDYEIERVEKFRKENFDNIDRGSSDRFIDWILLKHLKPLNK
ncbi:CDP-glycerol glycerophosphotransferase family protein [Timonella senegalensis]|uniref:CDP-glycerol glycerophosphotransferase family protein n=1 Tax=Timonella senegalensis TaxID=1465825 RepID=UPI002FDCFA06